MKSKGWLLATASAVTCGSLMAFAAHAQGGGDVAIEVLSSRPDLVTGGDALIRVTGAEAPTVTINGADVSAAFAAHPDGGWVGLVEGMQDGENTLVVATGGGQATETLVSHGLNDTLFAGPQQVPFVCENEEHGLAPAVDASCAAPTVVEYYYQNEAGDYLAFDPEGARPTDIARTTTYTGADVPIIVRVEKGVINRSAYALALLHDPEAGPAPTPTQGTPGWNGKLIFAHMGGVQAGYRMGDVISTMDKNRGYVGGENNNMHNALIERGFAFAAGSLGRTGFTTNHVVQAETVAKIKERFIEAYGPPIYTVGTGTSGGSMSQHLVAQNYPGLYDAITPWRSYPEVVTFQLPLYDCRLLANYFEQSEVDWTLLQKTLVSGKLDFNFCAITAPRYPNLTPTNCSPVVKAEQEFNPDDPLWQNVRCTYHDNLINVFGADPETGFARNYWDNEGVQYGLKAFEDGVITFEQFADLNRNIGGFGLDSEFVPERNVGNADALRIVHETGRINRGLGGLAEIPILDIRGYTDGNCALGPCPPQDPTNIDVHDGYHTLLTRARLDKANGHHDNQVRIVTTEVGHRGPDSVVSLASVEAFDLLDQWVTAVVNDTSDRPQIEKVREHKPAELVDACYTSAVTKITDMELCAEIFPIGSDARMVAGAPATNDIPKCALKPVSAADYSVPLTDAQVAALREVFPGGVCDFSQPSIGDVPHAGPWLMFKGDAVYEAAAL